MVIYSNLTHLARHEFYAGVGDGIAKCPFDPEDNSTGKKHALKKYDQFALNTS